jgi:hypothetical protein
MSHFLIAHSLRNQVCAVITGRLKVKVIAQAARNLTFSHGALIAQWRKAAKPERRCK